MIRSPVQFWSLALVFPFFTLKSGYFKPTLSSLSRPNLPKYCIAGILEKKDDPESFKTKEASKLSVLEHILQPELYPERYKDLYHKVRINDYPPQRQQRRMG